MKRLIALLLSLMVLMPMAASATEDFDADWSAPHAPYRVAGPIHYVGTQGIGVYLIASDAGLILIDTGNESALPVVKANIAAQGYKVSDIKYILLTHAHFDHVGGVAALQRETGAQVIAGEGDRYGLERGTHVGDNVYGGGDFTPVKVDRAIADGETVTLGNVTLTAHLTPGHTRGCTTWTLSIVEHNRPLDVVFFGSTTTAGNVLVGNKAYPGIADDYRLSFARLKAMRADIFLVNHPDLADLDDKLAARAAGNPDYPEDAFIDPGEFPAFVANSEATFEEELAKQQAAQPQVK